MSTVAIVTTTLVAGILVGTLIGLRIGRQRGERERWELARDLAEAWAAHAGAERELGAVLFEQRQQQREAAYVQQSAARWDVN